MAYSSISITAPGSAEEGERVSVSARVTNITAYDLSFKVKIYAVRDIYAVPEPHELIGSFEEVIRSGITKTYSGSFTMPAWDTIVLVMVHRFVDYWDYDTHASKVVSLGVPAVEEFAGTISRKQLEYDESRASIPVYNIPQGERGLVHIWGRNNMTTNEKLGIYWFVADPDGMVVEEYEDWEWGTTSPGGEHEFIGGRFNLDREKYTMWVDLLMNPSNPEVVDRYIGDLCTVAAAVPEYKGSIMRKELEYDEARGSIPVY